MFGGQGKANSSMRNLHGNIKRFRWQFAGNEFQSTPTVI